MGKISGFNKILTAWFMLAILFVCMAFAAKPALAATTPTYITSIGIDQDGSSGSTGINDCKAALSGHTIIDRDLNDGAGGDYVYMGYKTTTDPSKAITGIVFRVGQNPPASITYNGCTFNLVGGSKESNTAKEGGWIDLNGAAGGDYIYMYVTRDSAYGAPLTSMTVNESKSQSGYETGTNTSGNVIDLNQDAGGKYLYLHYQRFSATVKATYHYLSNTGSRTSSTQSATVKTHLETMTKVPSYSTSVTYDGRTFTFKGWREDNTACAATVTSPSATYMTGNKTYRSVYAANVKLSYDANGGSGAPSAQSANQYINTGSSSVAKQSVQFTISKNTYTHPSKCFLGWSANKSATTAAYQPGGTISISSNTTLYAVYGDHNYSDGFCERCGEMNPEAVAILSKNGPNFFADTSLDAVIAEAEKCTADDNAVVTILQSTDLGGTPQQINGGVFTLDLNGKTLSNTSNVLELYDGAQLTIAHSAADGIIQSAKNTAVEVYRNSALTVNGGNLTGLYGIQVYINGSVTINDGTISGNNNAVDLKEDCAATITGGSFNAGNTAVYINNSHDVMITDGSFNGEENAVYVNNALVTINSGSFNGGNHAVCLQGRGTATITDGNFTGGKHAICLLERSDATITGGSFTGGEYAVYLLDSSHITITAGSFIGTTYGDISKDLRTFVYLDGGIFPGGIEVDNTTLNAILDINEAYWAGNTMLHPTDDAQEITDKGDITVKEMCYHSIYTKLNYVDNGSNHTYTRSCCYNTATENHSYTYGKCVCGDIFCDHSGNENMRTDCTEALNCSACGDLLTEAAAAHIPGEDDGDCTTAVKCANCEQIAVEAKDAHTPGEDDNDCTTAVKCVNCDKDAVEARDHTPAEDDGDCTTAVKCVNCDKIAVEARDEHVHGENGRCAFCGQKVFAIINGKAYLIKGDVTHTGLDIDAGSYHNECYIAGDGYVALESDGVYTGSFTEITLCNATIDVRGIEAEDAIYICDEDAYISFFGENHLWADEEVLRVPQGNAEHSTSVAGAEDAVLNLHGKVSAVEITVDSGTVCVYGVDAEDSFAVDLSDRLAISEGAVLTVISGDNGFGLNSGIAAQKGIEVEGTLNAIVLTASKDNSNILCELTAYGDAVLGADTYNPYYGMEFPEAEAYFVNFHVPAGTSVTIPEGITLNLDTFDQVEIDGELIVKGTLICSHKAGGNDNGFCICGGYQPAVLVDGYYQIGNAGQLYWFAAEVSGGNTAINGKLTADIVVNGDVLQAGSTLNGDGSNFRAWTPIGDSANLYAGTFDGQNHTISGLYFNGSRSAGLFGEAAGCVIQNVTVADSYFYVASNGKVGGIVGVVGDGACIANCHNAGTVSGRSALYVPAGGIAGWADGGSRITDCSNSGKISSFTPGGITAKNYGTITNCLNTGAVIGSSWSGGIVGDNNGTVEYCCNTGLYDIDSSAGGIAGTNISGAIRNCYSTESGIVEYKDQIGTIKNCYYLNGEADSASILKTTEQFASGEVAFLLGEPFGQTIGTDETPVLDGAKVYQVTDCLGRTIYRNVNEGYTEHSYVDGQCEICGIFHESMWMVLPADLKTIEDEAFIGTNGVQIILPDGCETISEHAFASSTGLQYVYMPDSVTNIAENAFEGSDKVTFICESGNAAAEYADRHSIPCIIK